LNPSLYTLRFGIALLLGAAIGIERQWHRRMAGTRTHALVASGAATFVMAGYLIPDDPTAVGRIASYVVSGVGFLGAGVIFKEGLQVQGLNTAASIWCSAAVGVLTGIGYPHYSAITVAGVLIVNALLRPLAYKLNPPPTGPISETNYHFEFVCSNENEARMRGLLLQLIGESPLSLYALRSVDLDTPGRVSIDADLRAVPRDDQAIEKLVARLSLEDVKSVSWRVLPLSGDHTHASGAIPEDT
jgi:putative Mg2+ transporter-C (MgtC) family protein